MFPWNIKLDRHNVMLKGHFIVRRLHLISFQLNQLIVNDLVCKPLVSRLFDELVKIILILMQAMIFVVLLMIIVLMAQTLRIKEKSLTSMFIRDVCSQLLQIYSRWRVRVKSMALN